LITDDTVGLFLVEQAKKEIHTVLSSASKSKEDGMDDIIKLYSCKLYLGAKDGKLTMKVIFYVFSKYCLVGRRRHENNHSIVICTFGEGGKAYWKQKCWAKTCKKLQGISEDRKDLMSTSPVFLFPLDHPCRQSMLLVHQNCKERVQSLKTKETPTLKMEEYDHTDIYNFINHLQEDTTLM
jgi:hypothetical protein